MQHPTLRSHASMTSRLGCFVLLAFPSALLADASSLPDKWFFPGRPDNLKGLEGKPPPSLNLGSWIGDPVDVVESKGKVVVIDFWATWCGPCMAAIPENVAIVDKYTPEGLVFIGVHDANAGWDTCLNDLDQVQADLGACEDALDAAHAALDEGQAGLLEIQRLLGLPPGHRRSTFTCSGDLCADILEAIEMLVSAPGQSIRRGHGAGARR